VNLYSIDIKVVATAYVKANSEEEAREKAKGLHMDGLEVSGDPLISERRYDDPELPEISLSPAMTIYEPLDHIELAHENIPEKETEA
jgi:hypothetical protein